MGNDEFDCLFSWLKKLVFRLAFYWCICGLVKGEGMDVHEVVWGMALFLLHAA